MHILHDIEQTIARIETDIEHVIHLRRHHLQAECAALFSEVDNKIVGLKGWVEDVKQALHAGMEKLNLTDR